MTSPALQPIPLPSGLESSPQPADLPPAGSPPSGSTQPLMFSPKPIPNLFSSPPIPTHPLPQPLIQPKLAQQQAAPPSASPTLDLPTTLPDTDHAPQPTSGLDKPPDGPIAALNPTDADKAAGADSPGRAVEVEVTGEGAAAAAGVIERQAEEDEIIAEQFSNEYHDILVDLPAEYKRNFGLLRELEDKQQASVDDLKLSVLSYVAEMSNARKAADSGDAPSGVAGESGQVAKPVAGETATSVVEEPAKSATPSEGQQLLAELAAVDATGEQPPADESVIPEDVQMDEPNSVSTVDAAMIATVDDKDDSSSMAANTTEVQGSGIVVPGQAVQVPGGETVVMVEKEGAEPVKVEEGQTRAEGTNTLELMPVEATIDPQPITADDQAQLVAGTAQDSATVTATASPLSADGTSTPATATAKAIEPPTAAAATTTAAPPAPLPPPTPHAQMLALLASATRAGEDKIGLAHSLYDAVDRHIRRLDADLAAAEDTLVMGLRAGTLPSHDVPSLSLKEAPGGTTSRVAIALGEQKGYGEGASGGGEGEVVPGAAGLGKTDPGAGLHGAAAGVGGGFLGRVDPNEPVFCYCQRVSFGEMIGCENEECPRQWFHLACVGLTEAPKDDWWCPDCRKLLPETDMKRSASQPGGPKKKRRRRIFS